MPAQRFVAIAGLIALGASFSFAYAFEDHVFVVTSDLPSESGNCVAFDIESPWDSSVDLETTGFETIVRHFFGLHYVVHPHTGDVQVIDPATFDTVVTFSVGAGSNPQDILVVASDRAYVTRHASPLLYEVDPRNGDLLDTVDLGIFADADGIPEMSMMALDGSRQHLFVQIQRLGPGNAPVAPSYLAVLDVRTNQLVDCDPDVPGLQGIQLTGLIPKYKMQIDGRRLYVSEPGLQFDRAGGIDAIDLDQLAARGFITSEQQIALDFSGFVLTSPFKGFVLTHTDIALSSHLQPFSRIDGSPLGTELWISLARVDSVAHDPQTDQLYFPDPVVGGVSGVRVFHATTDKPLTATPIDTGWWPVDLVVARAMTPGEATDLRVRSRDPATAELSITYAPACGAANHTIVFGPLEGLAAYDYAGQVCAIGTSGEFGGFDPGDGSYFFLVVGNDGAATEGSYGTDSALDERPEDLDDPLCAFKQDLSLRCD